ncbi:MAG TPA: hypothetical protein VH161_03430 [Candidatus Acidoferrales bacterium]|jgi:hypothetical protein|nr:hypothetical protein [Candidatus Acidoferrales bacterium]
MDNDAMTQEALESLQKALTLPEAEWTALVRSLIESLEEVADQGPSGRGTRRSRDESPISIPAG